MFVLLFTCLAMQDIVYYPIGVLSGDNELPCVKGGGTACRDGGIVKAKSSRRTIPQPPSASAPFTQGSLFTFIYNLSIFLTSTGFVDTNATKRSCYGTINALKPSVSLIGSKHRLLFKQRMKSSTSVISESVTGCSSSTSENSGAVNLIFLW